jgi:hypothetical protein
MQYTPVLILSKKAPSAVTKRRFVGFDGAQISTQGAATLGVAIEDASQNEVFGVVTIGTAIVETGGAINKGDYVISDNQGRAIQANNLAIAAGGTTVTSTAANGEILTGSVIPEKIAGIALEDASGAGEFIEILLVK